MPGQANPGGFSFGPKAKTPAKAKAKGRSRRARPRKPKIKNNLSSYIYKVLKQVHPDTGISNQAMAVMNSYCWDVAKRIVAEAGILCELNKKTTISSREIQTGVRLVLPGELAKHAVSEGTKAITKFVSAGNGGGWGAPAKPAGGRGGAKASKPRSMSKSMKAGLQFPVGRICTWLKQYMPGKRVGSGAPVYLAAVMEYLAAELLELGGNASRDNKRTRIIPRHLVLALRNDEELNKLTLRAIVPNGGVLPNIHAVLLPRK